MKNIHLMISTVLFITVVFAQNFNTENTLNVIEAHQDKDSIRVEVFDNNIRYIYYFGKDKHHICELRVDKYDPDYSWNVDDSLTYVRKNNFLMKDLKSAGFDTWEIRIKYETHRIHIDFSDIPRSYECGMNGWLPDHAVLTSSKIGWSVEFYDD